MSQERLQLTSEMSARPSRRVDVGYYEIGFDDIQLTQQITLIGHGNYSISLMHYKWRKEYGRRLDSFSGLKVDWAKRYKELEQENERLRKIAADLTIDNSILKEGVRGNF